MDNDRLTKIWDEIKQEVKKEKPSPRTPGDVTVREFSDELGITLWTAKNRLEGYYKAGKLDKHKIKINGKITIAYCPKTEK